MRHWHSPHTEVIGRDVGTWTMSDWEQRLCSDPTIGVFSTSEIAELPAPVQRYFNASIGLGTPLSTCARLHMRGRIKVGRWLPFRAQQVMKHGEGFIWKARVAGIIAGSDRYLDGAGEMNWKLAGVINVAHGDGPDISQSTAGRCGVEAVMIPTALLPRFGVTWTADDDHHITAHDSVGEAHIDLQLTIDSAGLVQSVSLQRWGDPDGDGTWDWHAFGGEFDGHRTFSGLTIPSAGRLGWDVGTDGWSDGEFFRFEITSLELPIEAGRVRAMTDRTGSVDLLWIPLGAGQRVVRISGRLFEALCALVQRRPPRDLYHSALIVARSRRALRRRDDADPDQHGERRGVVAEGPVGTRYAARCRLFRYEIHRWHDGVIPDEGDAVSTIRVTTDLASAQRLLDLVPRCPRPSGDGTSSTPARCGTRTRSPVWLLASAAIDIEQIGPPPHGRAPGWCAGAVVAARCRSSHELHARV